METADHPRENALLKVRLAEVQAMSAKTQEANRRQQDILRMARSETFGENFGKQSPYEFKLPLGDAECAQGLLEAAQEKAWAASPFQTKVTSTVPHRSIPVAHTAGAAPRIGRSCSADFAPGNASCRIVDVGAPVSTPSDPLKKAQLPLAVTQPAQSNADTLRAIVPHPNV